MALVRPPPPQQAQMSAMYQKRARFDYRDGGHMPGDAPAVQQTSRPALAKQPPSRALHRAEAMDLENPAGTDGDSGSKKPRGACTRCCLGCCRCCCYLLVVLLLVLIVLAALVALFWPKVPEFEPVSMDMGSAAVFNVRSKNPYNIELASISGTLSFKGADLGTFALEDVVIRKKNTTRLEIPLKAKPSQALLEHCLTAKEFKVQMHVQLRLKALAFVPLKRVQDITLPCPGLDGAALPAGLDGRQVAQMAAAS